MLKLIARFAGGLLLVSWMAACDKVDNPVSPESTVQDGLVTFRYERQPDAKCPIEASECRNISDPRLESVGWPESYRIRDPTSPGNVVYMQAQSDGSFQATVRAPRGNSLGIHVMDSWITGPGGLLGVATGRGISVKSDGTPDWVRLRDNVSYTSFNFDPPRVSAD